ncbi:DinB family protein [Paenibacillus antarcticus]|uniref:Damage-inducible protein DinB n=1 Tax=Paenibacillus antarcticus TaxID=253703 RepID=A0A162QEQ9_9BACL|nr:DinB family protein [Paenibacillus antarcticus]OAB47890.1 hypothetical protein PBAT_03175 [Paenibacillus antarcticus]
MFVRIDDFVAEWIRESEITERVLKVLTDESLLQVIASDYRTLGEIAWHLVESVNYLTAMGLSFEAPSKSEHIPPLAKSVLDEYGRISRDMIHAIKSQWTDTKLTETMNMGGEKWMNGASLRFVIMHQVHHRGQMTILMRQAGLRVPDVYGPTREDWVARGMEPLR